MSLLPWLPSVKNRIEQRRREGAKIFSRTGGAETG
jgi:hypothetical protein